MRYFFAIFLPPLAILLCGKPGSFLLNLILTVCGWVPGMIHAIIVVGGYYADKRTDRIVNAIGTANPNLGTASQPQTANQGRPMKFILVGGGLAVVVACALAVTVAGLNNGSPSQAEKSATVAQPKSESTPLPVPGKTKRNGNGANNTAAQKDATPATTAGSRNAKPPPDTKSLPALSWTYKDGREIEAKFIKLDGESVVIEKEGKVLTVPFSNLDAWGVLQAKQLGGVLAADVAKQKALVAAEQPKVAGDAYRALLSAVPATSKLVENVAVEQYGQRWTATITVRNVWHLRNKQIRLQDAQTLWKAWATVASKNAPDHARIKLIDLNGNEVGGSRSLAGSMIWVQD